jgi:hypothetical protein
MKIKNILQYEKFVSLGKKYGALFIINMVHITNGGLGGVRATLPKLSRW